MSVENFYRLQRKELRKFRPEVFRKIGHGIERSRMMAVNPLVNLFCAKARISPRGDKILEFGFCKLYQFVIHRFIIDGGVALIYCLQRFTVWKECSMAAVVEPAKCRVALLAGGTSGEREISLASGKGAGEALR